MFSIVFYTVAGKFDRVPNADVEVKTWEEVQAAIEKHCPGAKKAPPDVEDDAIRFTNQRGRNVAFVDQFEETSP